MGIFDQKKNNQFRIVARYVYYRVKSELTAETARTYLSYVWWLLEPILTIAVFYVVFGMLFERGGEGFVSFLLLGVTAWFWFQHSISKSVTSIRKEARLMSQVYVPKYTFPLCAVTFMLFKHLFVVLVLVGMLLVIETPSVTWFFYPLIFLVQLILILALSVLVAAIVPFIPDLTLVVPPLLRLSLFLSGVFYSQEMIPAGYVHYFRYNPLAGLIMEYRKVMLYGQMPDFVYLIKIVLISSLILAFGLWLLAKLDRIYPRLNN
ncbi:MAG: ABC transporter permease [Xanthomonadales bacterium]|nr:ABC transporter permease [Xanthomonadales bacterium]